MRGNIEIYSGKQTKENMMENLNIINKKVMINIKTKGASVRANKNTYEAVMVGGAILLSVISGCGVEDRTWKNSGDNGVSATGGNATSQTTDSGSGQGTDEGKEPDGGQESAQPGETIAYQIPEGWSWTDPRERDAIRGQSSSLDSIGTGVKLELLGVSEGDAASAQASVKKMFDTYKTDCLNLGSDCAASPEYIEIDAAGIKVYCAMSAGRSFSPDIGWSTYLEFAKNGRKAGFMLYDRADRQNELLEKVTATITWE